MAEDDSRGEFWHTFELILTIAGIAGIIFPAFLESPRPGFWEAIESLFHPTLTFVFVARWLSILPILLAIYIAVIRWIYRDLPISIIWMRVDVYFASADGSEIRFERRQALRANQRGVTAYYQELSPSSDNGRAPERLIEHEIYCRDKTLKNAKLDFHGDEKKGYEITHEFGESLPYSKLLHIVPLWAISRDPQRLWSFFRRRIAMRTMSVTFIDEFNVPRPSISITSSTYAQHKLELHLHFPRGYVPKHLRARRRQSYAVTDVPFPKQGDEYSLIIDRLRRNETLRITWQS
jgi:hypothetical protein